MLRRNGKILSVVRYLGEPVGSKASGYKEGLDQGCKEQKDIMFGLLGRDLETIEKEYLDGMAYVGGYAFYNYSKLKTVRLPESITYLKGAAFQNCTALTTVELPESLVDITANGFMGCTSLTSLTIPAGVKTLAGNSLRIGSADNKATIRFNGVTPPSITTTTFNYSALEKIEVPIGALSAYTNGTNWSVVADNVPIVEVPV